MYRMISSKVMKASHKGTRIKMLSVRYKHESKTIMLNQMISYIIE